MGLFDWRKSGLVVGAKSFYYRSSAREYFAEKYAFVGEQLQKLCSDTGLKSVEAEISTGGVVSRSEHVRRLPEIRHD